MSIRIRVLIASGLLGLLTSVTLAEELVLQSVVAGDARGETRLRVNSRNARFNFDAEKGVLAASGTWYASHMQPNGMTRFTHQVEDMTASADGVLSMRSYQCVEGLFGKEFLGVNICGNYGLGPNQIDEGGLEDDIVKGPPISLRDYRIMSFDRKTDSLVIVLGEEAEDRRLTLTLVRPEATGGATKQPRRNSP